MQHMQPTIHKPTISSILCIENVSHPEGSALRLQGEPVGFPLSPEDRALVATLKTMTVDLGGVGLAAPQIGISKRVAAI